VSAITLKPIVDKRLDKFTGPEFSIIKVENRYIPKGAKLVEAYETDAEIIVLGEPETEPEGLSDAEYRAWEETSHNCDAMGCATFSHVAYRFPKLQTEADAQAVAPTQDERGD
jgi:hypothetical protein